MNREAVAKFIVFGLMLALTLGLAIRATVRIDSMVSVFAARPEPSWTQRLFSTPAPYLGIVAAIILGAVGWQFRRGDAGILWTPIARETTPIVFWLTIAAELACVGILARFAILALPGVA